jgi:hypothetical protein
VVKINRGLGEPQSRYGQFVGDRSKGKVHPRTGHEGPEGEKRYSSTLSLTSALDGVGVQRHDPADLPPGKSRYPFYRKLGGSLGRSGRMRKISPPAGFDPRTVQPAVNRYTDWAMQAPRQFVEDKIFSPHIKSKYNFSDFYPIACSLFTPISKDTHNNADDVTKTHSTQMNNACALRCSDHHVCFVL